MRSSSKLACILQQLYPPKEKELFVQALGHFENSFLRISEFSVLASQKLPKYHIIAFALHLRMETTSVSIMQCSVNDLTREGIRDVSEGAELLYDQNSI